MAIDKLPEFSKNGQKNTDGLNQEDGFPVNLKPARQWFNFLFNKITVTINQLIDQDYIRHDEIVDNLTTDDAAKPLSSKQGKKLQDEKFAKTGGSLTGNLSAPAVITDKIWGTEDVSFASVNDAAARRIRVGGLLVSNAWGDADKVPTNGSFVKGDITTNSNVNVGTRDGAKNSEWNSRINIAPPSHGGTWGVGVFDDSANAMMGVRYSGVNVFYTDHLGNLNVTSSVTAPKFRGTLEGNADSASKLQTARNIAITGAVSGNANFDGSGNITINTTANNAIGVGQSWQDVTTQRANNTIYTNTTGRPIQLFISVNVSGQGDDNATFTIYSSTNEATNISIRDASAWSHLSFIIPPSSSYKLSVNTSQYLLLSWSELR